VVRRIAAVVGAADPIAGPNSVAGVAGSIADSGEGPAVVAEGGIGCPSTDAAGCRAGLEAAANSGEAVLVMGSLVAVRNLAVAVRSLAVAVRNLAAAVGRGSPGLTDPAGAAQVANR
jgi:hypothetical protein